MVLIQDIYLSAAEVKLLANKDFTVAKAGSYVELPVVQGDIKSKLILPIKLSNGKVRDWIPNKTSIKFMVNLWGDETDQWLGKTARFVLTNQNVRGEMKDVIFVESLAPVQKV